MFISKGPCWENNNDDPCRWQICFARSIQVNSRNSVIPDRWFWYSGVVSLIHCDLATPYGDIGSDNGCLPDGDQAILWINIYCSLVRYVIFMWEQFHSVCSSYYSVQCVWKVCFWNYCHTFQVPMSSYPRKHCRMYLLVAFYANPSTSILTTKLAHFNYFGVPQ